MTPFWVQIINFFTIILGSALSIVMTPVLCSNLGDALAVILIDITSSIFYTLFIVFFVLYGGETEMI